MRKVLLPTCLCLTTLFSFNSLGQSTDTRIEQMMTRRSLTAKDVSYNIASMAPDLYRANKTDTLRQLIDYYERNYGYGATITSLKLLLDIKDRQFREELAPTRRSSSPASDSSGYVANILPLLRNFNAICSTAVAPGGYTDDINEAYRPYLSFIGTLAQELKATPGLSPAELFLTNYLAHPAKDSLNSLGDVRYNGTRLQRAWLAEQHASLTHQQEIDRVSGASIGVVTGVWMPTGNLSLLGPHPYAGFVLGGRARKFSVEANINIRFVGSAHSYTVVEQQQVYNTSHYLGGYIGVDGMYELWKKHKQGFELLGGIAWDGFDALESDPKNDKAPTKSLNSLNINAGLGYRLYFPRRYRAGNIWWGSRQPEYRTSYLAIQAKYNFINYKNDGGTPMDGHGITFGIIFGAYSKAVKARD